MKKHIVPAILIFVMAVLCLFTFGFKKVQQGEGQITLEQFNKKISNKDTMVLVYFHAGWCTVCAKMKPVIEQVEKEFAQKIKVLRIDTDRDKEVAKEFEIDALPVLILYKNGKREWISVGITDKAKLKSAIEAY